MPIALTARCDGHIGGSAGPGWDYLPWYNYHPGVSWLLLIYEALGRENWGALALLQKCSHVSGGGQEYEQKRAMPLEA